MASETVNLEALHEAIIKMKVCLLDEKIASLIQKASALNDPIQKAKIADERIQLIRKRNELFMTREE